ATSMSNFTVLSSTEVTVTVTSMLRPSWVSTQVMVVPTVPSRSPGHSILSGAVPTCLASWVEICFSTSAWGTFGVSRPQLVRARVPISRTERARRCIRSAPSGGCPPGWTVQVTVRFHALVDRPGATGHPEVLPGRSGSQLQAGVEGMGLEHLRRGGPHPVGDAVGQHVPRLAG